MTFCDHISSIELAEVNYTKNDLNYNVQLVTELLDQTNINYLRNTYWNWVKDQTLELKNDFLEENNPCEIYRLATQNEIGLLPTSVRPNSVFIDFDAIFLKKDATAIAKIPKTLPATPLTSRLWNFTFTNVPDKRYIHFKLSSNQPNAKFHIYKLLKNLPAGYTGCQDPDGSFDYTDNIPANTPDPRDFEVDNETRIVVLGSNLEYVNPADLTLEMSILKPKLTTTSSTGGSSIQLFGEYQQFTNTEQLKIYNTGDLHSTLEYKQYFASTNIIDLINPTPIDYAKVGSGVQTRSLVVPPAVDYSLYAAPGFNPNSSSEGSLTVRKRPSTALE